MNIAKFVKAGGLKPLEQPVKALVPAGQFAARAGE